MRQLTHTELRDLRNILFETFTPLDFPMLLSDRLGINFINIVAFHKSFEEQLFDFLGAMNRQDRALELLDAFVAARPKNEKLLHLARQVELPGSSVSNLEALVTKSPFYDVTKLMLRLTELFRQVCRIELDGEGFGTGFIVGPDLVMTNYHVAKVFIENKDLAPKITVRFDYRFTSDGITVYKGNAYNLSKTEPVAAFSPYDEMDERGVPIDTPFPTDKLDYALLRLSQPAGEEPAGPRMDGAMPNEKEVRGWLKYSLAEVPLAPKDALFIVQHPQKRPMEIAFDTNSVSAYDPNK